MVIGDGEYSVKEPNLYTLLEICDSRMTLLLILFDALALGFMLDI